MFLLGRTIHEWIKMQVVNISKSTINLFLFERNYKILKKGTKLTLKSRLNPCLIIEIIGHESSLD
jgi:hypothetical protein